MKKYFVFIVLCLFIGGMSAQAQVKFGIKAGVNLSSVSLKYGDDAQTALKNLNRDNLAGFQVGPMVEGMFALVGFDLAVLYSQENMNLPKFSPTQRDVIDTWEECKMNNLKVPLNLKVKIMLLPKLLKVYGTMGPYINLKLSSDLIEQWEDKSFGAGMNFGFGAEVLSHLQVGVNYQLGLTEDYSSVKVLDIVDFHGVKAKSRIWSVTAAYLF